MAKRAAPDEKPYRPLLDTDLVSAALAGVAAPASPQTAKVVDLPKSEQPRRFERPTAIPEWPHVASVPVETPKPQATIPVAEKFDQERRVLLTRSESQALDRLVNSLATRVNAQVKASHILRSLVTLLLNAEPDLHRRTGEAGVLVRPANGDAQALQRFEREIARIVGSAITDAGPIR
jgi:hypothetical protein